MRSATKPAVQAAEPEVYEMTFFNVVAKRFIETGPDRLSRPETTEALLAKNVREIEFPAGSAALKTFWYHVPKDQTVARPGGCDWVRAPRAAA